MQQSKFTFSLAILLTTNLVSQQVELHTTSGFVITSQHTAARETMKRLTVAAKLSQALPTKKYENHIKHKSTIIDIKDEVYNDVKYY